MADFYDNRWVRQIVDLQHADGSWGYFHSLGQFTKTRPITTEQALRRLYILGLTKADEPIDRALGYMNDCLLGRRQPPDRREKVLNWDAFQAHMLAAWIRLFVPNDPIALAVARMWAEITALSFQNENFDEAIYAAEYRKRIPILHTGERMIRLPQFYMVNLLKGLLDETTEAWFIGHIISNADGIYYVYASKIAEPPGAFASRKTSFYLAALEQITGYSCASGKLGFAKEWLVRHRDENGEWDLGAPAKDGVYFPLSDSWRKPEDRKRDCTIRVEKLLKALGGI